MNTPHETERVARLLHVLFVLVALTAVAVTVIASYQYGLRNGNAAGYVVADLLKFMIAWAIVSAWRNGSRILAIISLFLIVPLTVLSILSQLATTLDGTSKSSSTWKSNNLKREELVRARDTLSERRSKVSAARPAEVVKADIDAVRLNPRWHSSRACERPRNLQENSLCTGQYSPLLAELAAAKVALKLEAQINEISEQLTAASSAHAFVSPRPEIDFLATLFGLEQAPDKLQGILTLVFAVCIELASCIALPLLRASGPSSSPQPPTPRLPPNQPARSLLGFWNSCLARRRAAPCSGAQPSPADGHKRGPARPFPTSAAPEAPLPPISAGTPAGLGAASPSKSPSSKETVSHVELNTIRVHLESFYSECITVESGAQTWASDLYSGYVEWAKAHNLEPVTQARFGLDLTHRFSLKDKSNGRILYHDLALRHASSVG